MDKIEEFHVNFVDENSKFSIFDLNETFCVFVWKGQNSFFFNSEEIGQFLKIGSHFLTESQFCLYTVQAPLA